MAGNEFEDLYQPQNSKSSSSSPLSQFLQHLHTLFLNPFYTIIVNSFYTFIFLIGPHHQLHCVLNPWLLKLFRSQALLLFRGECHCGLETHLVTAQTDENLRRTLFFMVCVHEWVVNFFSSYFLFQFLNPFGDILCCVFAVTRKKWLSIFLTHMMRK